MKMKKIKIKDNETKKIDEWLRSLSPEAVLRITKVTNVLKAIGDLKNANFFELPYDALDKTNLDRTSQQAILQQLWEKHILEFAEPLEETSIDMWQIEDDVGFTPNTLVFIDSPEFKYLHSTFLNLSKVSFSNSEQDGIYYHKESGVGFFGKKRFKFKDHQSEFRVFGKLFDNINRSIQRHKILQLMEFYTGDEKPNKALKSDETYEINELCKKIRKRTGLSINELVNNNGNLSLIGSKLKKPPVNL